MKLVLSKNVYPTAFDNLRPTAIPTIMAKTLVNAAGEKDGNPKSN
jgi:hypothetical protein